MRISQGYSDISRPTGNFKPARSARLQRLDLLPCARGAEAAQWDSEHGGGAKPTGCLAVARFRTLGFLLDALATLQRSRRVDDILVVLTLFEPHRKVCKVTVTLRLELLKLLSKMTAFGLQLTDLSLLRCLS